MSRSPVEKLISFSVLVPLGAGLFGTPLSAQNVDIDADDIGIRMALGADRVGLARSVVWSALRPMLVGGWWGSWRPSGSCASSARCCSRSLPVTPSASC